MVLCRACVVCLGTGNKGRKSKSSEGTELPGDFFFLPTWLDSDLAHLGGAFSRLDMGEGHRVCCRQSTIALTCPVLYVEPAKYEALDCYFPCAHLQYPLLAALGFLLFVRFRENRQREGASQIGGGRSGLVLARTTKAQQLGVCACVCAEWKERKGKRWDGKWKDAITAGVGVAHTHTHDAAGVVSTMGRFPRVRSEGKGGGGVRRRRRERERDEESRGNFVSCSIHLGGRSQGNDRNAAPRGARACVRAG